MLQRSARSFCPTLLLASATSVGNIVVVVLVVVVVVIGIGVGLPGEPERPSILCPIWVCGNSWPVARRRLSTNLLVAVRSLPKLHGKTIKQVAQSKLYTAMPIMTLGRQ